MEDGHAADATVLEGFPDWSATFDGITWTARHPDQRMTEAATLSELLAKVRLEAAR